MSNSAYETAELVDETYAAEPQLEVGLPVAYDEGMAVSSDAQMSRARPVPRISIQAFCETDSAINAIQVATEDRRLSKTHVSLQLGGIGAAVAHYQEAPTPNLIVVESRGTPDQLLADLDALAEVCDSGTKVLVIGHSNDVRLYRELLRRGVSEYIVSPVSPIALMESISNLYTDPSAEPVGQVYAFVGAKGGCGSSTVCHNVAWSMSRKLQSEVVIADLDLPFGTAGLDFDRDPVQGIADALSSPDRLDEVLLERLLSKCSEHLSLFAAPGTLDRDYDIDPQSFDWVIDVVRQNVPYVALDIPHLWTGWARQLLLGADQIVITAAPDLANLRNAKNLIDLINSHRKNDRRPFLVINQAGVPKRPEIPSAEFAKALGIEPIAVIDFDAENFGLASNNGQMLEELDPKCSAAEKFRDLSMLLANKLPIQRESAKPKSSSLLSKFSFSKGKK